MGKLKSFTLSFTNSSNGVFQAGQLIQGQLFMDLEAPMSMRCITLQFHGVANVHWTEQHSTGSGKNRRTVTRHYNNEEVYFNEVVRVWGTGSGGGLFSDSPEHPSGRHVYPFQFQLPANLPSSYEGAYGKVRYSIKGKIDKPWKFDHTTKLAFTVLSTYDLNQNALSRNPSENRGSKTLCCLCCKSGPISAVIRIDRTGYVPGEFLVLNGEVDNKSNRTLSSTSVELRMVVTFQARSKSRSVNSVIQKTKRGEVEPGESEIWNGERIHLPPLPPSDLIYCSIIDIKYILVLVADPSGPAFDLEVPLNLIIGTVPLQNIYGMFASAPFQPPPMPMPVLEEPAPYPDQPPSYPSAPPLQPTDPTCAPPPSYAESVFGKVNIKDDEDTEYTKGELDYAPVYTYYSYNQGS